VKASELVKKLAAKGWMLATAESCTGGLVAAAITDISGSSAVFDRGFVTYSNDAKTQLLAVPAELISRHGAVSEEVAHAMAEGALRHSAADIAVSVTGIAGPMGGSAEKPVGLVHFACATKQRTIHLKKQFDGLDRAGVRQAAVAAALQLVSDVL
jgi:nicotinamide-nucleotide amidase